MHFDARNRSGKSIRYYYFTSIATVLVSGVLVMGLLQLVLSLTYFRQQKDELLQQVVDGVQESFAKGSIRFDESLQNVEYMANVAEAQVFITDAEGHLRYSNFEVELEGMSLPGGLVDSVIDKGTLTDNGTLSGVFRRKHNTRAASILDAEGNAIGIVFASADASGPWLYVSDTLSSFILSGGLVLLVSTALALALSNRTLVPVRRVSEAAQRFGEGDYSARVPVEGDDELAQLAVTFNEMASSCEATDTSRRSFMGNIAHELRTPMTSIKGFIDGMIDGTIPEDQRDKYLGIVSEEVGRLARLTQNMLDISKLEAGEYTPTTTTFNIWGPIGTVFTSSEQRIEERNIFVNCIQPDEAVMVQADEDFVHQILFNIVDNALKFINDDGTITVRIEPGKSFATVTVTNTGSGIPPEELAHIFDRFYKADKSRGLNSRGSGLGLHICKVLLGLMGGRIWADSVEGEWTSFHFTLPSAPARWNTPRFEQGKVKETTDGYKPEGED